MEESKKHKNINELLETIPKVKQMVSPNGNAIPNQLVITGKGFRLFQSYDSWIALVKGGVTYLFEDWDYSVTTSKYRNIFLGESSADTLRKLRSGEYVAVGFEVD